VEAAAGVGAPVARGPVQDLFQSGVQMGNRIVQEVGSGDVVIFIITPGSLNLQPRVDGAISAIKASGKPINVTHSATSTDPTQELSIIDAYYLGHKSVKGPDRFSATG
jgi:simple sugar transport system substrate-binding protein